MSRAIALAANVAATAAFDARIDTLRRVVVVSCALALILAGRALPLA